MKEKGQIVIYQSNDANASIEVQVHDETVWLNRHQLAALFNRDIKTIGKHITNVFKEGEVDKKATVAKYATVQKEGKRTVSRKIEHYNLDVIISVGYRVKSKQGTRFRIWANSILKAYLLKGYALNEERLKEKGQQLAELKKVIRLQEQVMTGYNLEPDEARGLVKVISGYATALDLLDNYDHQRLELPKQGSNKTVKIGYKEAKKAIEELGKQTRFEGLFGKEKDDSFKSSLANIYQTFDGVDLYKTTEEKAAHLLYFVTKNHSFVDGNKRIAAFVFVWFLELNNLLFNKDGEKSVSDNTLVAVTLMIAQSHPMDKDIMITVLVNLLVNHE